MTVSRAIILAAASATVACFNPDIPQGRACSPTGDCPGDQTCSSIDNRCYSPGNGPGSIDAPLPDAPMGLVDAMVDAPTSTIDAGGCTLSCPLPDPGKATICGTLRLLGDDGSLEAAGTGQECLPSPSEVGACRLALRAYDALQFASGQGSAPLLTSDQSVVNDCGNFMLHNVVVPSLGFIALSLDDHSNTGLDVFDHTGVAFPLQPGERKTGVVLYAAKTTTVESWTTSAGNPFGNNVSFTDRGVYVPIFLHQTAPVAGVKVTEQGAVDDTTDYYFSDTSPTSRFTIDSVQAATGANGTALKVDTDLVMHGGTGAEPTGCQWPEGLADAIPGVVFASRQLAEDSTSGDICP